MYSRNIIFNGCMAVEGQAIGIVIKTGDNTFIGKIAKQTTIINSPLTSLQKEMNHVVKVVFIIGLVQAIAVFILGVA